VADYSDCIFAVGVTRHV